MADFKLGKIVVTNGIYEKMQQDIVFEVFVKTSLGRYSLCDWGNTCKEDSDSNNIALSLGERILAVYEGANDDTIWIITEADRSVTTVLFPSEY